MTRLFAFMLLALSMTAPAGAFETAAKQAIILDYDSGAVLFNKAGDEKMYPASMTKMLTVYILFGELKSGKVKLDDTFFISDNAWQMKKGTAEGSNMFVELHSRVKVEDLLRGIVIQSGNDACIAVAEGLAGSNASFADRMNEEAKKIGMTGTHFTNPDGWPDPEHYTTAHDLATLAWHIIHDYPEYYHYFSEPEFTYNGIRQGNRNMLLNSSNYKVDGLKTGHTEASGYGMVASGTNDKKHRIIVVVNGLSSMKERASEAGSALAYGFTNFDSVKVATPGEAFGNVAVAFGQADTVPAIAAEPISIALPRNGKVGTQMLIRYDAPLPAPVRKGDRIAQLVVRPKDMPEAIFPLVAGADMPKAGFGRHAMLHLKALLIK